MIITIYQFHIDSLVGGEEGKEDRNEHTGTMLWRCGFDFNMVFFAEKETLGTGNGKTVSGYFGYEFFLYIDGYPFYCGNLLSGSDFWFFVGVDL